MKVQTKYGKIILISPLEGEKKFLGELCELRNFREGYKKYKNSDRATKCAMTNVGDKKGKIKMNENNLQQKQPNNPVAFLENKHSLLPDTVFSRFTSHFSRKRIAFTLAEVLITLGIIGVVAALTLPSLVASYRKQETITHLKKFYSTFTNAIRFSEIENGDLENWEYAPPNFATSDSMKANDIFFNKYLFPYFKGLKKCNARDIKCNDIMSEIDVPFKMIDQTRYVFTDGACIAIISEGNLYNRSMVTGILDWNCSKKPNKAGQDQFYFHIMLGKKGKDFIPFHYGAKSFQNNISQFDRETLKQQCINNNFSCGALIQHDNWEISKDYPVKF